MKKISLTLTAMAIMAAVSLPADAARSRVNIYKSYGYQVTVHKTTTTVVKKVVTRPTTTKTDYQSIVITNKPTNKKPTKPVVTKPTNTKPTTTTTTSKVDNTFTSKVGVNSAGSLAAGDKYRLANGIHFSEAIDPSGYFDFKNPKNDINKLVLGNKEFNLAPKKAGNKGIETTKEGQNTLNVSHYLDYAKHGNYMAPNINGESVSVIFYQGYETPKESIPTSGKAHYKGVAVQSVIDVRNQRNNATSVQGKSEFDVDFAQKTIQGQITPNDSKYGNVKLAGKVKDNQIIGNDVNGYRSMEGRFYGPNAEEISGRYDVVEPNKQYVNGTFGAKKQ